MADRHPAVGDHRPGMPRRVVRCDRNAEADHRDDEAGLERARTLSAVFRDSRVPQFRDTYAWALVRSNKNIEEAVAILKKIVKDNDSVGVYKFHLGEAYRKMGEVENARSTLELAMRQLAPESHLAEQAKAALAALN